jgi:hypothetical protein
MISSEQAVALALALPETGVADHHGIPSLRVAGKIFATVPDERHLRVMADEGEIRAAVAEDAAACSEFWWGSRLAAVLVDLRLVEPTLLSELLSEAWRRKAPRRVVREYDARPRTGGG